MAFEEPTLPPLLASSSTSSVGAAGAAQPPSRRKRSFNYDLDLCSSSDPPPLFSSDDHLASSSTLDNYAQPRRGRKRQYRGTWWGAEVRRPPAAAAAQRRREFKRTVDSGVWMGSEGGSLASEDDVHERKLDMEDVVEEKSGDQTQEEEEEERGARAGLIMALSRGSKAQAEDPSPEACAQRIIQLCLEEGNERVDLSGLHLTSVSGAALLSLRSLTRHPAIDDPLPPSQEAYGPLTPSLALFLSRNLLHTVPGPIMHLENLTVLSLRNNKLRELPAGIGRLTRLTELNIGGNRLQWLPWEILNLLGRGARLTRFSIHPNPFVERDKSHHIAQPASDVSPPSSSSQGLASASASASDAHTLLVERGPFFLGASPITSFDIDGSPRHASHHHHHHLSQPARATLHGTPSLLELALRSCASSPHLTHLVSDSAASQGLLARLLRTAQTIKDSGGQRCSVCGRDFLVARTEWIEWWDLVSLRFSFPDREREQEHDPAAGGGRRVVEEVPLRRKGCGWGCTP